MEPNKTILLPVVLAILVSAVVFGGLGYYLANSKFSTETSTVSPTYTTQATVTTQPTTAVSLSPATMATSDQTADWKSYNNTNLGFSIKYPSVLKSEFFSETNTYTLRDDRINDEANPNDVAIISVDTYTGTLDQLMVELKNEIVVANEQKTTLNGKLAYEGIDQGVTNRYGIYAVENSKSYLLRFQPYRNGKTLTEMKAGLSANQKLMIDSFRFIK